MNTYHAFYRGKQIELTAETSYKAQLKAAEQFRARKSYEVTVILVATGDQPVEHKPQDVVG